MNGIDLRKTLYDWFASNDWSEDELKARIDSWSKTFGNGKQEDLQKAIEAYNDELTAHKARVVPRPADIKEKYRDIVNRREMKEQAADRDARKRLTNKVNTFNTAEWNPNQTYARSRGGAIINQRAHNLCKHWEGFRGYSNKGITGKDGKDKTQNQSDRILALAWPDRDVQMDIEAQALQLITSGQYSRAAVPQAIQTKYKWTPPYIAKNPLHQGIKFNHSTATAKKESDLPSFVEESIEEPMDMTPQKKPESQNESQPEPEGIPDEFQEAW